MILMARPLIGAIGELTLWVGAFDTAKPELPTFLVDKVPTQKVDEDSAQWFAIRDRQTRPATPNQPCNFQGIFRLPAAMSGKQHEVTVNCAGETFALNVLSLPDQVPDQHSEGFSILLASCYSQPADPGYLESVIKRLKTKPNIVLLAGDQGYLDLPLLEDIPEQEPAMSNMLGAKYRKLWLAQSYGIRGLYPLFNAAPTACIADDHEYWNNFPFIQAQLPGTHSAQGRARWGSAARALYEDFQLGGNPARHQGWQTIDVSPLRMLLLDTRSDRQADFNAPYGLITQQTEQVLLNWVNGLIDDHSHGKTTIGILVTGQSLLATAANSPEYQDAEYANFDRQYQLVLSELDRLASAGIPVICLTGDVHWSRVTQLHHTPTNTVPLTEVICSPSSLFELLGYDQLSAARNYLGGLFKGKQDDWLRFPNPERPPAQLHQGPFTTNPAAAWTGKGNMISLLTFNQAGTGVDMTITYYPLHSDPRIRSPQSLGPIRIAPNR